MQEIRGKLKEVAALGASGRFAEMRSLSDDVIRGTNDIALLLDVGALLSGYGFLTDARTCYEKAQTLAPTDLRAAVNLANLARDAGEHTEARWPIRFAPETKGHPLCFT